MASDTGKRKSKTKETQSNGQAEAVPEPHTIEVTFNTYLADAYTHEDLDLSTEEVLDMYRTMLLQRRFE